MNELQIFNSEEFGDIRTVTIENEPWFVGKDVAEALGYSNASSQNNIWRFQFRYQRAYD